MKKIQGESKLTFFEATSIIVGHGVGSGILSVPFLASRNSLREILLIVAFCYLFNVVLHLIIAELSYNNDGAQFISCMESELFAGRIKKILTWVAFGTLGLSVIVNVSAFLTGAAAVFRSWFGLPDTLGMLLFYIIGAGVVFIGMKLVGICEKLAVGSMIGVALWVYLRVSKPLALRSMVYVIVFSVSLLLLDHINIDAISYSTENGTSTILGPLVAGVINGYCYSVLLKASAYSGGTDFVAALIHKHRPDQSILGLILTLNCGIAIASYFVYDYQLEPVILCILYSFMSTTVSDRMIQHGRSAVRVEIITKHPEQLRDAIIHRLRHSATLVPAQGLYQGQPTYVVVCVVNRTQVSAITKIVREIPDTFTIMSSASQVMGNFKHLSPDGKYEKEFLDQGDGKAV